jgi:hypothetical protein
MSKETLKLTVKKPCTESWDTMTPNEKGKHCLSCQKTVVDFTAMTDSQIIFYFQNYQDKTCGRFLDSQLQRPILPPFSAKNHTRWAWLFSALLLPISVKAQTAEFNIERVSKLVFDIERKENAAHYVRIPMKDTFNLEDSIQYYGPILMGDVDKEEEPFIPLKTSKEMFQDVFNVFKNLIMSVLSFFISL